MDKELKFLIDLIGDRLVKEDILESKHFKEIYDAIALEDDNNLSQCAKELKEKLLKLKPLVKSEFTEKQIRDMVDSRQEEPEEIISKSDYEESLKQDFPD